MSLKKFFKPTILKIVIFVVLLIVSFFGAIIAGMRCDPIPCYNRLYEKIRLIIGFIPYVIATITRSFLMLPIIVIVYSYVLSCILSSLISIIYKKFRKK